MGFPTFLFAAVQREMAVVGAILDVLEALLERKPLDGGLDEVRSLSRNLISGLL